MSDDEIGRIYTWNKRYLLVIRAFTRMCSTATASHDVSYYEMIDMEDGMICEVSRRRVILVFRKLT